MVIEQHRNHVAHACHHALILPAGSNGTYHHTGIPPGDYTLKVTARDPVRGDHKEILYDLQVKPQFVDSYHVLSQCTMQVGSITLV